jgi:hypothetical protein
MELSSPADAVVERQALLLTKKCILNYGLIYDDEASIAN